MATLDQEISAIRRFADRDFLGCPIAFAFGVGHNHILYNEIHPSWHFEITVDAGYLISEIDFYSAAGLGKDDFDEEAWEALKLRIAGPCTKSSYRELARLSRGLMNGRNVVFNDGTVVDCVGRAA